MRIRLQTLDVVRSVQGWREGQVLQVVGFQSISVEGGGSVYLTVLYEASSIDCGPTSQRTVRDTETFDDVGTLSSLLGTGCEPEDPVFAGDGLFSVFFALAAFGMG